MKSLIPSFHNPSNQATAIDLYLLGIAITIGGQVFSWNDGLKAGFWEFFTCTILTGSAYVCLALCLSEMTSALPFSGGLFGFVRVTINPFWGFMVACCETIQNIFYVAASIIPFANIISHATQLSPDYEPIYWLIFFSVAIAVNILNGRTFWTFVRIMSSVSILLLVIYILGSFQYCNFPRYALDAQHNTGSKHFNFTKMLEQIPLSSWFYVGMELIPLAGAHTAVPRDKIPYVILSCIATLILLSVAILFTVSSQFPGAEIQASAVMPLSMGYSRMFDIDFNRAAWFSVPATFVSSFGFMFAYGRQLSAMAKSGMVPQCLQWQSAYGTPYMAFLLGSAVAIAIIVPVYISYRSFVEDLFFWCTLGSFFIYMCAFVSFIEFRKKFSSIERSFVNPLGIGSAVYGMAIFTLNFVSIVGFQGTDKGIEHRIHPIAGFLSFMAFALIWYCVYTHKHQCFSDEEQKVMFSAYVIKANVNGRKKLKGKDKANKLARQQSMAASNASNSNNSSTVSFFSFSLRSHRSAGRQGAASAAGHSSAKSENSSMHSSDEEHLSSRSLNKLPEYNNKTSSVPEDEALYSESNPSHSSTNDAELYSAARYHLDSIISDSNFSQGVEKEKELPASSRTSRRDQSVDDEPISIRRIAPSFVEALQGLFAGGSQQAAGPISTSIRVNKISSSRETSRRMLVASKIIPVEEEPVLGDLEHDGNAHSQEAKFRAESQREELAITSTATEAIPDEGNPTISASLTQLDTAV